MSRRMTELWVVGRCTPGAQWELVGIFETEAEAVEACSKPFDFLGPVGLGEKLPDECIPWPRAYYPKEDQ